MNPAILQLMPLLKDVDVDAIQLLVRFGKRAIESGDPNKFLKEVLRNVVDAPVTSAKAQVVSVKVLPAKKRS